MFRLLKGTIKLLLIVTVCIMIYLIIQFNPFTTPQTQTSNDHDAVAYDLEDNALFSNIPLSQVKNAFNFMDKKEFMAVSGLNLMGYNDEYLAGKRGDDYILYRFGERQVLVFPDEYTLNQALTERNQQIDLKDISSY
ncbi:DUF4930 family protein [Macrococcoides canis]|uniref:DUF4930 family protein n=1 Tax=Macrococcoides canis TaxID=1855823 RepID=A0A4R6C8D2_9STAP|nr:DUF4930 family protein [Macrococcus canis]MEE1108355.1 DUF4930 family protein [Macrococcus canis]TDM18492.1 DUF4930 family protein [Macrococcus canis]TDM21461.1 DUF4930 family protein [Macrococcus canis]TDM23665.1 DUF4930 family protein [Macrococcus canis]TDM31599.1 DUF4930 family protein [Macrococcus canis]